MGIMPLREIRPSVGLMPTMPLVFAGQMIEPLVSLLSIVNVVLLYVVEDLSLDTVLLVMNALISVILFADFVYRLLTAPSRSESTSTLMFTTYNLMHQAQT